MSKLNPGEPTPDQYGSSQEAWLPPYSTEPFHEKPKKMRPCKTCKTLVSKKASVCPACGMSRPAGGTSTGVFLFWALILALVAGFIIYQVMQAADAQTKLMGF